MDEEPGTYRREDAKIDNTGEETYQPGKNPEFFTGSAQAVSKTANAATMISFPHIWLPLILIFYVEKLYIDRNTCHENLLMDCYYR